MVSRLASTLEDFEVLVLFSLEVVLFSWTRMVIRSPTARARLSANIEREEFSFHNEPEPAWESGWASSARHAAKRRSVRSDGGTAKGNLKIEKRAASRDSNHRVRRPIREASLGADDDGLLILD